MYDYKDLQRLYGEKYFSHRTRPEMWNRRAEFVFEKLWRNFFGTSVSIFLLINVFPE